MEILARFNHEKINHAVDNDGHLVLSLVAPALSSVMQRPKLAVLVAVDLSGSMRGSKLEYVKRSLRKLVDHLAIGDVCGIVGFENHFHTLLPPEPVTPEFKEKLRKTIDGLRIMGGTNFADAVVKSIQSMQDLDLPLTFLQRVILFTDGQPTVGIVDKQTILKMAGQSLGEGRITMSFFGYGSVGGGEYDGCDPEFMLECSKVTNGNYAYVADPDAALGAFGKELGGLLSAYASDIRISVEPVNGHQVTRVVSDVEAEEEDVTGQVEVKLTDLLAEETRHIVLSTKLLKQNQAFPRPATIFNIKVIYTTTTPEGVRETKTLDSKARVQFVKADEAQKEPDKEVDAIVGMAQLVRSQIEAEDKAKGGDYKSAGDLLEQLSQQLHNRGHQGLGAVSRKLGASVGSHAAFSASTSSGYLSSMKSGGTRAYGVSSMGAEALADLASTGTVSSNSVMDNMVRNFQEPVVAQPAVHIGAPVDVGAPFDFGGGAPFDFTGGGLSLGGTVTGLGLGGPGLTAGGAIAMGGQPWVAGAGDPNQMWGAGLVTPQPSPEPALATKKPIKQRKSRTRW